MGKSRGLPVLRSTLLACVLALPFLGGCASAPEPAPMESAATSGELTLVVVFESVGPVPARGKVTSLSTMESILFDTSQDPDGGQTLTLEAGQYSVAVEGRYLPSGSLQPVKGERVLYLEADAREFVRVIVSDREDMGYSQSSQATTPRLPTSASGHASGPS